MKIAFAYPGQGAQKIGMAKDFVDSFDWAKDMIREASEASGIDMEKLLFEENEDINITEFTQPALVTACMIMTKALTDEGITPDITGGLSLGEYCALVASGAMTFADAVKLTRIRGSLMSNTVPAGEGTMAAVIGLESNVIENVIKDIDGCTMANYNCPGQIVITGKKESVEKAMPLLSEAGARKVVPLVVSGPFHSPMLKPAGDGLRKYLDETVIKDLNVPYVANCNAEIVEDKEKIRDFLQTQVYSPVMWEQSMRVMKDHGVELIIEIGPGKTIAGFVKKTIPEIPVINVSSVEDIAKVKEAING
ncbi:[acyl-carrier-protein] S-malonyltransferase [Ruminococcaceae bacterium YRB3002]|nr:[acyl-carrier-protein] S-malonyltransferase [Ruminococcaceae bacterium YRB3002]